MIVPWVALIVGVLVYYIATDGKLAALGGMLAQAAMIVLVYLYAGRHIG